MTYEDAVETYDRTDFNYDVPEFSWKKWRGLTEEERREFRTFLHVWADALKGEEK